MIKKGFSFLKGIYYYLKWKKRYDLILKNNYKLLPFPIKRHVIINKKKRYLRGDSYLFHIKKEYEPGLNSLIQKISALCDKEIVLDIGANIGMTAIIFSELFQKVIAFEPSKESFNVLNENLKNNMIENVETINYGLGNEEKILTTISPNLEATSKAIIPYLDTKDEIKDYNLEKIIIKNGDKALNELSKDKKIGLIKIDVEGFELEVLKGLETTLKKNKPVVILEMNAICLNLFTKVSLPNFLESLDKYFPILIAYNDSSYENIDISSGKKEARFKVMKRHLQNGFCPTIVCFHDEEQLSKYQNL
tara:strand:+ start:383 stop:1300 length:918 start_codon:yes stop_codon:yes gene_type:complete